MKFFWGVVDHADDIVIVMMLLIQNKRVDVVQYLNTHNYHLPEGIP